MGLKPLFSGSLQPATGAEEWSSSPCSRCGGAPCCRNVPMMTLQVRNDRDLASAEHLASHQNIEIGIRESGEWIVFYTVACRFLDPVSAMCKIHGTNAQPDLCKRYDAHTCWYRRVFVQPSDQPNAEMLRLNATRVRRLRELVLFDDRGEIYRVPDWELLQREFVGLPLDAHATATAHVGRREDILLFPPGRPLHRRHLDLIRFRLGFPGVSLRIDGDSWQFALAAPLRGVPFPIPESQGSTGEPDSFHAPIDAPFSMTSSQSGPKYVDLSGLEALISSLTFGPDGDILFDPDRPAA